MNSIIDNKKIEHHSLEPFLPKGATMLMLGSFPPPRERWTMDFFYPNFQNDMWRIFGLIFFDEREYFVIKDKKVFDEKAIRSFLSNKGIAIYDTAVEVIRKKGNASDLFLEITKATDIKQLLQKIPKCNSIVTTGQKATETLMNSLNYDKIPIVGGYVEVNFNDRLLRCYRMPSSSRAYPKPIDEKAADYKKMFSEIGLL